MFKVIAVSKISLRSLFIARPSEEVAKVFEHRRNLYLKSISLVSAETPSDLAMSFSYSHCVLHNFSEDLRKPAQDFVKSLRWSLQNGTELQVLPDIKPSFTVFSDTIPGVTAEMVKTEQDFYLIHALIEALATPILNGFEAASKNPQERPMILYAMANNLQDINCIMSCFDHYIQPHLFNAIRRGLSPASGAQSPLRFLDRLLYGTSEASQDQWTIFRQSSFVFPSSVETSPYKPITDKVLGLIQAIPDFNTTQQNKEAEAFLSKMMSDFHFECTEPVLDLAKTPTGSYVEQWSNTAQLIGERLAFKLHHYEIIKRQIPHAVLGTGGTALDKFLVYSMCKDLAAFVLLHSASSDAVTSAGASV